MRGLRYIVAAVAASCALAAAPAGAQASCPWMQGAKTPLERANELIGAMSLAQKLHQVTYSNPAWFTYFGTAGHVDGTPSLCIPTLVMSDAGSGVAGLQLLTTTFPSGVGQAAMWDPALERRFGQAMGQEAWGKGINVMLGPGVNIARIATNGRNFEYMGEDPYLAGQTAAAAIQGIQSQHVLAEVKHYAANNQETDRMTVNSVVDQRTLREIYLPAFEAAVKQGHVGSIMCSYNKLNGDYACQNKQLLDGYLRRDWGFTGFVTSDWGATHSTVGSALAGMDLEMNAAGTQYFGDPLRQAIAGGQVPVSRLDDMLRQIFVPMFQFGLFDNPPAPEPGAFTNAVTTPEHRALARQMAEESTVLLKNDGHILPLGQGSGRTIAVIGYAAGLIGSTSTSGGGGSSKGLGAPAPVSPLAGIQRLAAAHGDHVIYADGSLQADAAAAARAADVAIVFGGDTESEGQDRPDLGLHPGLCVTLLCVNLPLDQDGMIAATAAANPNTVVVIDAGGPARMPWLSKVKAVLDAFYPGTENGNAIASILYGDSDPSGKLPQSFPRSLADMPASTPQQYPGVGGKAVYSEGLDVGYRWFDSKGIQPLFPFGYGLSYTTFRYSRLRVRPRGAGARVTFTIANTGDRYGGEVGQVYVGFPKKTGEPPHQLKGFRKVFLDPGASQRVTVDLDARAFEWWSTARSKWKATRGCYSIWVGGSSRDLPLRGSLRKPSSSGTMRSCASSWR